MFYSVNGKITFPGGIVTDALLEEIDNFDNQMAKEIGILDFEPSRDEKTVTMEFGGGAEISDSEREEFDEFIADICKRYDAIQGCMEWSDDESGTAVGMSYFGIKAVDLEIEHIDVEITDLLSRRQALMATGSTTSIREIEPFPLLNNEKNPHQLTAKVARTGDEGIYNEVGVGVYKKADVSLIEGEANLVDICVADVLVGLDPDGDLRVLVTTGGNGDAEHTVAIYPMDPVATAVDHLEV